MLGARRRWYAVLLGLSVIGLLGPAAEAEVFGGVDFPNGAISFADEVLRYECDFSGGACPTEPAAIAPQDALGIPDFPPGGGVGDSGTVALGDGGLIEVRFVDNLLINSGDLVADLHIFEVGNDVEDTFVAVRPTAATASLLGSSFDANGDGFYEVGKVFGSVSSIDLDSVFFGFDKALLEFDAVQLVDDPNEGGNSGTTVGADIDAIGAIGARLIIPDDAYADAVMLYDCNHSGGPCPTDPAATDPNSSLGPPDFPDGAGTGSLSAVALGRGGLIRLLFVDNRLTNSGDSRFDVHIFEVGSDVEDTFVEIRPTQATALILGPSFDLDGDGFYEIGVVAGSTTAIDIDLNFPGHQAGELVFDAIELFDDPAEGESSGLTVGADIDAVGAISSISVSQVPALSFLGTSLLSGLLIAAGLAFFHRRRSPRGTRA